MWRACCAPQRSGRPTPARILKVSNRRDDIFPQAQNFETIERMKLHSNDVQRSGGTLHGHIDKLHSM